MTRGAGAISPEEVLYGEHASTRAAEPLIELTGLQEVGLKAVAALMIKYPAAPGFQSSAIREAGYPYRPDQFTVLSTNNAGTIVSGLVKKGLAEKTPSVHADVTGPQGGWIKDEEHGWRLTHRGLEYAKALGVTPFQPRRPQPQRS